MVKFSEIAEYKQYMRYYAAGNLKRALRVVLKLLDTRKNSLTSTQRCELLRVVGDIHYDLGHDREAVRYYEMAEQADPTSLLMKYFSAKFFAIKLHDNDEAVRRCDEILDITSKHPFAESDEDFSSDHYARLARELRSEIVGNRNRG